MEIGKIEEYSKEDLMENYCILNQFLQICDRCSVPPFFAKIAMLILESKKTNKIENFAKARSLIMSFKYNPETRIKSVCEYDLRDFSFLMKHHFGMIDKYKLDLLEKILYFMYQTGPVKCNSELNSIDCIIGCFENKEGARFGLFASNMVENVNIVLDLTRYRGGRRWDLRENKQN